MTNEQIGKWLSNLKDDMGQTQHRELWHYAEALDMAIEALSNSQNQSESLIRTSTDSVSEADVIHRADAIDALSLMQGIVAEYGVRKGISMAWQQIKDLPSAQPEIIRCKDCTYFEYNHVENVDGIPLIVAHEICNRWSDGVKTSESGFCFLAERRIDG